MGFLSVLIYQCNAPHLKKDSNILLIGIRPICRFVHHQWRGTSVIEKIDGCGFIATVGRGQPAVEIRHEVDLGAVEFSRGQDPIDLDADIGLGVVPDDSSVDQKSQQGVLICGIVVLQQSGGVVIAYWCILWSLGHGCANGSEDRHKGFILHCVLLTGIWKKIGRIAKRARFWSSKWATKATMDERNNNKTRKTET